MKYPNLYIVLIGEPGIGKSQIAAQIQMMLRKDLKSSVVSEGNSNYTKEYLKFEKIFASIVTTTPAALKKNGIKKML